MSTSRFFDYGTEEIAPRQEPVFLRSASAEDWAALVEHCERRRFRAGDVVVRAGEVDRSLLIVLDGELQPEVTTRGRRRRLPSSPAGSIIGELGFLDGEPRSATVVATRDGELLRISLASFEALAATNPRLGRMFLLDLGAILAHRLRSVTDALMAR